MSDSTDFLITDSTDPRDNGRKVVALVNGEIGHADLYRKILAGPSGQRSNLRVGRVRFVDMAQGEFKIVADDGETAGWATRNQRNGESVWVTHSQDYHGAIRLLGWADSLSIAVDVVLNGIPAATGRHDSARTSSGKWEGYVPKTEAQLDAEEAVRNANAAARRLARRTS